ncbi:DUF692 domain-containing protein [Gallaecimonas kandeliae]|uniref:HvfB family MNIO-type RiPP peptide maturase n=1 Tax=Gallaecimonas kandeliae TaxID=3029055 RepID=UPI0026498FAF|nr:DUF692 domain-containing protein [Gallaecimonas kandeliae]WKE64442.1 DUF692 domain-containing protein [Gallaecimonas kandeliae]
MTFSVQGAGLGLRRDFMGELEGQALPEPLAFLEVAPENWMRLGGPLGRRFRALTEQHTVNCHGLSLSIGGPAPLDRAFLKELKAFLDLHQVRLYSEHLSFCSGNAHLYDLMPIPFTEEAVRHVAARVREVQQVLERPLALENVSYYAAPGQEMAESDFIKAVLEEADCQLLLDVNNIHVNAINHGYDAEAFLKALPSHRIACGHIAGHHQEAPDLIVDTHGADVIAPVWELLEKAYRYHGVFPTLLERDFNIPSLDKLLAEVGEIHARQQQALRQVA